MASPGFVGLRELVRTVVQRDVLRACAAQSSNGRERWMVLVLDTEASRVPGRRCAHLLGNSQVVARTQKKPLGTNVSPRIGCSENARGRAPIFFCRRGEGLASARVEEKAHTSLCRKPTRERRESRAACTSSELEDALRDWARARARARRLLWKARTNFIPPHPTKPWVYRWHLCTRAYDGREIFLSRCCRLSWGCTT